MNFEDTASAAEAAAESAKQAIAAAGAAAYLANRDSYQVNQASDYHNTEKGSGTNKETIISKQSSVSNIDSQKIYRRHSYNVAQYAHSDDESEFDEEIDTDYPRTSGTYQPPKQASDIDPKKTYRRHSYNVPSTRADIKFDESDCDEDFGRGESTGGNNRPPDRPAPEVFSARDKSTIHRVHPKLPDYDSLAARFEELRHRRA